MSFNIIDRRKVARDKSASNRERFLKRVKGVIQEQLPSIIKKRKLVDMDKNGANIKIARKGISEPQLSHSGEGIWDIARPGNDRFIPGDKIPHPPPDSYGQDGADSEDDFIVELSREEFMDAFFEGLALPDLVKKELLGTVEYERHNAGYQSSGSPSRLHLAKSYMNSYIRRKVLNAEALAELERDDLTEEERQVILDKIDSLPLFEKLDLRYRSSKLVPIPSSHATVIFLMDVSASMGEREKLISRKFFWLFYAFLRRMYDNVEIIFVAHTTSAVEMSEEEFFSTRLSGGTLVSSGLELVAKIIKERSAKSNIYVAQASDGDNMPTDNGTCSEIIEDDILPLVQYYAYLQIHNKANQDMGYWKSIENVAANHPKLQMREISEEEDIFGVFRELFKK